MSYLRFVFEIDRVAVALLQDACVEVVPVVRAELPPAEVLVAHAVSGQPGRLDVPDHVAAVRVLVADLNRGCSDAVDALFE